VNGQLAADLAAQAGIRRPYPIKLLVIPTGEVRENNPLALALTWTFLISFSTQMLVGILVVDGFAILNLLFAWLSIQRRSRGFSAEEEAAPVISI
jgi:hypothetical protein